MYEILIQHGETVYAPAIEEGIDWNTERTGSPGKLTFSCMADEILTIEEGDERIGCVIVDKELSELLQVIMDKYTFEGVETSWRKMCYYYKQLG